MIGASDISALPEFELELLREDLRDRRSSRFRRNLQAVAVAGTPDPGIRWRTLEGPYFDNQVGTLEIDRRSAVVRLDKTVPGEDGKEALEESFSRRIA